jgi:serine/threonine protein kinase
MKFSFTRPRVYLIDFEVAIQFPTECPESERVSTGLPLGGSFTAEPEQYARRHAPEFASGIPYSPFKLDVWQLGISFSDFKVKRSNFPYRYSVIFLLNASLAFQSTIPAIDEVLVGMTNIDPVHRLDAKEALGRLGMVICSMTPESLLIKPVIIKL